MTEESILPENKKFCECGCGQSIQSPDKKGRLRRFVRGHSSKGSGNAMWNGGRKITQHGYVLILKHDHPYSDVSGYVLEHRLVMEQHIGRYLTKDEDVHHINGNKTDNRIENLELTNRSKHTTFHNYIDMSDRVCSQCGDKNTYIKKHNSRPQWNISKKTGCILCVKCYKKEYVRLRLSHLDKTSSS
jgi:hypothetical protein